jgi:adsorption protein B
LGPGHCDEFVESHARVMPVRDAWRGLAGGGVGCGFSRAMLERIGDMRADCGEAGPFAAECFTEDYEIGLLVTHLGGSQVPENARRTGAIDRHAQLFPDTLVGRCARRRAGSTALPCRAGTGWAGWGVRWMCGWRCATGAGRWWRWCLGRPMRLLVEALMMRCAASG